MEWFHSEMVFTKKRISHVQYLSCNVQAEKCGVSKRKQHTSDVSRISPRAMRNNKHFEDDVQMVTDLPVCPSAFNSQLAAVCASSPRLSRILAPGANKNIERVFVPFVSTSRDRAYCTGREGQHQTKHIRQEPRQTQLAEPRHHLNELLFHQFSKFPQLLLLVYNTLPSPTWRLSQVVEGISCAM